MNELAFRLRSAFPWSMPAFKWRRDQHTVGASLTEPARSRFTELSTRFDLARWSTCCDAQDWAESLFVLDVLDRLLPKDLPAGRALDVGAKNGAMLPGLVTATSRGCDAVELDAHRRYLWGSTRRVYGEAMSRAFDGCRFIAGDVRSLDGPWALVTWWLPFLFEAPLVAWGLPRAFLAPRELLEHVTSRVLPSGALFIVNQGAAEAAEQRALLGQLGRGAVTELGQIESVLSPFRRPRYGFIWRP